MGGLLKNTSKSSIGLVKSNTRTIFDDVPPIDNINFLSFSLPGTEEQERLGGHSFQTSFFFSFFQVRESLLLAM